MDLVQGTRGTKASKLTKEEDDFSIMLPADVITNIMDRLPIRDVVRTGILSRTWRYKWTTMLSQVAFDEHFFKDLVGASQATKNISVDDCRNVILKLLLHLKGSITKFILYLPTDMTFDVEDINHWFLFLSGKGIKDVTVNNDYDNTQLKLPAHFFSCQQLMHLKLQNCSFDPPPSFRGFPNLLSLDLFHVQFDNYKFEELITRCPLVLESLRVNLIYGCQVKQVDIAKLENLTMLSMSLEELDTRPLTSSRVIQLVASFPKLQELDLNVDITFLAEAGGNKMDDVLATFPCLKTLKLRFIDLANDTMASFVLKMIRSSPNLQTLNIWVDFFDDVPHRALSSSDLDCIPMSKLQLQSVVFVGSDCSENEVYLIKFLLACSPLLKKFVIGTHPSTTVDESHNFAAKLLKLHRASPVAEIDFSYFSDVFSFLEFSRNFS